MAQVIADRKDVDFVLFEQLKVDELSKHEKFAEFNKKTVELVIAEARNLAVKEILPTQKEGDDQGCVFDNGKVIVPECYKRTWELFLEGEWLALPEDPEYGGQGMPRTVAMACGDYFNGANYAFMMYPGLTHGAALLVEAFGTEKIKKLFLLWLFFYKFFHKLIKHFFSNFLHRTKSLSTFLFIITRCISRVMDYMQHMKRHFFICSIIQSPQNRCFCVFRKIYSN